MNELTLLSTLDSIGYSILRVLASTLWQSSILFFAVFLITYLLRNRSASIRYKLWVAALLALPVIPVLSYLVSITGTPHTEIAVMPSYSMPYIQYGNIREEHSSEKSTGLNRQDIRHSETPVILERDDMTSVDGLSLCDFPWAIMITGYFMGAVIFLSLIFFGRLRLRKWSRDGIVITGNRVIESFRETRKRLGVSKDFVIIEHDDVPAPCTVNTHSPLIFLPAGLTDSLSDMELRALAAHELSHVKRNDPLILTVVSLIRAVFYFHPFVWFGARQISELAEAACDNMVLETVGEPISYAELLTRLAARLSKRAYATELGVGIVFSKHALLRRVKAILSDRKGYVRRLSKMAVVGTVCAVILSVIITVAFPLGEKKKSKGEITLSGRVMHEYAPVANANMYIHSVTHHHERNKPVTVEKTEWAGKTDREGVFTVTADTLLTSNIDIVAYATKYAIGWKPLRLMTYRHDTTIQLDTASEISGVVRNSEGIPVEDAKVSVRYMEDNYLTIDHHLFIALRRMITNIDGQLPGMTVKTDRNGQFTLHNLPGQTRVFLDIIANGYAEHSWSIIQSGSTNTLIILKPEGRIEGRVIFGDTHEPASGIGLVLGGDGAAVSGLVSPKFTVTDRDGKYSFASLSPDRYEVRLATGDSFPEWTAFPVPKFEVHEGDTISVPNIELIKGGIVTGVMTNTDTGEPVPDVRVSAQYEDETTTTVDYCHTDENGSYRLRVPPGKVKISGYGIITKKPMGGKSQGEVEQIVEIAEGETKTGINLPYTVHELDRETVGYEVTIHLVDNESKPVPDAYVYAYVTEEGKMFPSFMHNSLSDSIGIVTLTGIKEGTVLALQAEQKELNLRGRTEITVKSGVTPIIHMEQYNMTDIRGHVVNEHGAPLSGVAVTFLMRGESGGISHVYKMLTDTSGVFVARNLPLGKYFSIGINAEGYKQSRISLSPLTGDKLPLKDIVMYKADQ